MAHKIEEVALVKQFAYSVDVQKRKIMVSRLTSLAQLLSPVYCVFGVIAASATPALAPGNRTLPPPLPVVTIEEIAPDKHKSPFEKTLLELRQLRTTGAFQLYNIGKTHRGKPIPMVVIPSGNPAKMPQRSVLVISGQHGDEPAAPAAVMQIVRHLSLKRDPQELLSPSASRSPLGKLDGLDNILWLIIPVANPDGYDIGSRLNGRRIDINRDWITQSQPETRAIVRLYKKWKPDIVVDLHQWSIGDPGPVANGIEVPYHPDSQRRQNISGSIAASSIFCINTPDRKATVISGSKDSNPSLAHRYFATAGSSSMLVETAADSSQSKRVALLKDMLMTAAAKASTIPDQQWHAAYQPFSQTRYPAEFRGWQMAKAGNPALPYDAAWARLFALLCIATGIMLAVGTRNTLKAAHGEITQKCRGKRQSLPTPTVASARGQLLRNAAHPPRRHLRKKHQPSAPGVVSARIVRPQVQPILEDPKVRERVRI